MISARDDSAKLGLPVLTERTPPRLEALDRLGSRTYEHPSCENTWHWCPALDSPDRMIAATLTGRDATAWHMPDLGTWPRDDHDHHIVVVGAGIAGLSAGALLASRGCKVLVHRFRDSNHIRQADRSYRTKCG